MKHKKLAILAVLVAVVCSGHYAATFWLDWCDVICGLDPNNWLHAVGWIGGCGMC